MSIFKAYDVRGIVPDQLDAETARRIGQAYANWLLDSTRERTGETARTTVRVGLGRDARPSGDVLVPAFVEGLTKGGAHVVDFGQTTTPMLYFGVGHLGLDGGVVATASHNPPQYNGFKFTREDAYPISYDTGIAEIQRRIQAGELRDETRGGVETHAIMPAYREFVLGFLRDVPKGPPLLRVAIDTANGMAGLYADLFHEFGIEVEPLYFEIDCTFPNHEANPLKASTLVDVQRVIREKNCDLGFAFDGDADRCVALDELGQIVRADIMTGLLALEMLKRKPGAPILYDLRSSKIVPEVIELAGGRPVRVRVGHSFAKARMRETGAVFGGELSGHCYYWDAYKSDSAILTLVEVLNMIRARGGMHLSTMVAPMMAYYSTGEINFRVADKEATLRELERRYGPDGAGGQVDWLDGITVDFGNWWFNVRPSNTEPLLRLTLEAKQRAVMQEKVAELKPLLGDEDTH